MAEVEEEKERRGEVEKKLIFFLKVKKFKAN